MKHLLRVAGLLATGVALGLLAVSSVAHANGRFPASSRVITHPTDPMRIAVQATFGVVVTQDGGQSWRWICEQGIGYMATYDPFVALTPSGNVLVSLLPTGLNVSTDNGCNFAPAAGLEQYVIRDLVTHPDGRTLLATTAQPDLPNGLFVSSDEGRTFAPSSLVRMGNTYFQSVRVSAKDPMRWYANSYNESPVRSTIYVSKDGGQTWQEQDFVFDGFTNFTLLDVNPQDPETLYGFVDKSTEAHIPKISLVGSHDAGKTWTQLLTLATGAALSGFTVEADGQTLWASTEMMGTKRSTDGGMSWQTLDTAPHVRCLNRKDSRIFACGENFNDGFSVGYTDDGGKTFSPIFKFDRVKGVNECPAASDVRRNCDPLYPAFAMQIGTSTSMGGGGRDGGTGGGADGGGDGDKPKQGGCAQGGEPSLPVGGLGLVLGLLGLAGLLAARRAHAS
jgi:photosystem II stability/assembly factor-like uncharacterized protein